jgi:hypothetical protein
MNQMNAASGMTFAEFELLPDIEGKRELIDGEVASMPPRELNYSRNAKRIFFMLLAHLQESQVWPDGTGYRIARGWIEPDVSVSWPDQRRNEKYDALEVWVIDCKRKTMTVYLRQTAFRPPRRCAYQARCRIARITRLVAASP